MNNFSTRNAPLIKRYFSTLAQNFFKRPKNLLNNFKKIGDWMTLPNPRSKGVGSVIQSLNNWVLL